MCHVYNEKKKYETAVFTLIRDSRYGEERINISNLTKKKKNGQTYKHLHRRIIPEEENEMHKKYIETRHQILKEPDTENNKDICQSAPTTTVVFVGHSSSSCCCCC